MKIRVGLIAAGVAVALAGALALSAREKKRELPREEEREEEREFGFYRVTGVGPEDVLFIREGADKESKPVGAVPADGRCVEVKGETDKWSQVSYRGVSGYARTQYLTPDDSGYCGSRGDEDHCSRRGNFQHAVNVASGTMLWIWSGPGKDGERLGAIPADGRCIEVLNPSGEWWQVRYRGVTGYVNAAYLRRD